MLVSSLLRFVEEYKAENPTVDFDNMDVRLLDPRYQDGFCHITNLAMVRHPETNEPIGLFLITKTSMSNPELKDRVSRSIRIIPRN